VSVIKHKDKKARTLENFKTPKVLSRRVNVVNGC